MKTSTHYATGTRNALKMRVRRWARAGCYTLRTADPYALSAGAALIITLASLPLWL